MRIADTKTIPSPPSLMAAFTNGFDAIANHLWLLLFPFALDLLLWFGPRLRMTGFINLLLDNWITLSGTASPEATNMLQANREILKVMGEQFNLMVALRSFPVGIPSLMASRLPATSPVRFFSGWDLGSIWSVMGSWFLLTMLGLVLGAFYFSILSQAALTGQVDWRQMFNRWPWTASQVILLTLAWFAILIAVSIPAACILTLLVTGLPSVGRFAILLYGGFMVWLIFPLIFSAHAIFVFGDNVLASLKKGVRLTRMTLPTTSLFFLIALVIGQGLDILWRVPEESSWLSLVGVAGHAFVISGLLAASFVYYREADRWIQKLTLQWRLNQPSQSES